MRITGANATLNGLEGNFIGVSFVPGIGLTNQLGGVQITSLASSNIVGGLLAEADNVIAHNAGPGIHIASGRANSIYGNTILDNTGKPILLGFGANDNVKPPVLDYAYRGSVVVQGTITGAPPNTECDIEVMSFNSISSSVGKIGVFKVTTDGAGNAVFNHALLGVSIPERWEIFARLTARGSSSENSVPVLLSDATDINLGIETTVTHPAQNGGDAVVNVILRNKGPATAVGVMTELKVAPGSVAGLISNPSGISSPSGDALTVNTLLIAPGQFTTLKITGLAMNQPGSNPFNVRTFSPTQNDSEPRDNIVSETVSVPHAASSEGVDVAATLTASESKLRIGQRYTVTAEVGNIGAKPATIKFVVFENDGEVISATATRGIVKVGKGLFHVCDIGTLMPGERVGITAECIGIGTPFNETVDNRIAAYLVPNEDRFLQNNEAELNIPFSGWGQTELTHNGASPLQYFNLSVGGSWVVQNVPVLARFGPDTEQTIHLKFLLGVFGVPLITVNAGHSLTPGPIVIMPPSNLVAPVGFVQERLFPGEQGEPLEYGPPGNLVGGTVSRHSTGLPTFPNREQANNECAPGAIVNSLTFLNEHFSLLMDPAEFTMDKIKTAIGWTPNGAPVGIDPLNVEWVQRKDQYLRAKGFPITTTVTADPQVAMNSLNNRCDVAIRLKGHVASVVGMTDLGGNRYSIDLAHDLDQSTAGGNIVETVVLDLNVKQLHFKVDGSNWSPDFLSFVIACPVF